MQQIKVKWVLWSYLEEAAIFLTKVLPGGFMRRWHQSGSGKIILAVSVGVRRLLLEEAIDE